tara:strand:- start:898 stop:1131 length:234 start_codon:yes stop_codon:yes gene_type:complete
MQYPIEELRRRWTDVFIVTVMEENTHSSEMDLSSEHDREAIVLALQDAIEFFSSPEFGIAAATLADCWAMRRDTGAS